MIVVKFKGGLGNQMFEYAFYKKMKSMGKDVVADLSTYDLPDVMSFVIQEAFPSVTLETQKASEYVKEIFELTRNRNIFEKVYQKMFPLRKWMAFEKNDGVFLARYLKYKHCFMDGYWQTEKYWKDIKQEILRDFRFAPIENERVVSFADFLQSHMTVCVHIRRGDYNLPQNQALFGGICTQEYYQNAIKYILDRVENAKFVVFSDDVAWVRKNMEIPNCLYIREEIGGTIPDWQELYLMSCCKHNIIANSTFSWWGAYLNKNEKKIVIAPNKWINNKTTKDIWPDEWIKLGNS